MSLLSLEKLIENILHNVDHAEGAAIRDNLVTLLEEDVFYEVDYALVGTLTRGRSHDWVDHVVFERLGQVAKHGCVDAHSCVIFASFWLSENTFVSQCANHNPDYRPIIITLPNYPMTVCHSLLHSGRVIRSCKTLIELHSDFCNITGLTHPRPSILLSHKTFLRVISRKERSVPVR